MKSGPRNDPSSTLIQVSARKYEPSPIPIHSVPRMPFVSTPAPPIEGSNGMLAARGSARERVLDACVGSRAVLAVSGGADSMALANAIASTSPQSVAAVATFDHGTGAAAREAADLVSAWARAHRVPVRVGRGTALPATEAAWRSARWAFLRRVAAEFGAPVATAHSLDDQVETVFIRLLRGSGARGLAGLLAPGPVLRPFLTLDRATIRDYANAASVPFIDDPSNRDLRFLRNRVRLELLPLIEHESPGFRDWLISLGQRAAGWRRDVSDAVDRNWAPSVHENAGTVQVPRDPRRLPSVDEAALFWPDVAGRVGLALDRRGTARLASFTTKRDSGLKMPLAGGAVVRSARFCWTLERPEASASASSPPIGWHHAGAD